MHCVCIVFVVLFVVCVIITVNFNCNKDDGILGIVDAQKQIVISSMLQCARVFVSFFYLLSNSPNWIVYDPRYVLPSQSKLFPSSYIISLFLIFLLWLSLFYFLIDLISS